MLKAIGPIAMGLLILLGILMIAAPNLLIREDKRGDPQAVATTRKAGVAFIAFALFAGLKVLKYSLT